MFYIVILENVLYILYMSMFPNNIRILVVNWLAFLSNKPSAFEGLQKASKLQISLDQLKSRSC